MPFSYTRFMRKNPLPENREQRYLKMCRARFSRIPALNSPAFVFGLHEGYKDYHFGLRVGPNIDVDGVIHDLAHIVEFGQGQFRRRCVGGRLHFNVPRKWIYNRYCEEPQTGQASLREARTFGIQVRLKELMGYKVQWDAEVKQVLSILRLMHDWIYFVKDDSTLVAAMEQGYRSATDEVIDSTLRDWFARARRSELRKQRQKENA